VLDVFERQARVEPRLPGVHHEELDLWVHVSARVAWLPRLVIVYTFHEARGAVDLWNLHRL